MIRNIALSLQKQYPVIKSRTQKELDKEVIDTQNFLSLN